jgi:hypothetical protein
MGVNGIFVKQFFPKKTVEKNTAIKSIYGIFKILRFLAAFFFLLLLKDWWRGGGGQQEEEGKKARRKRLLARRKRVRSRRT